MVPSVNGERRPVKRPNSFIFTLYGDLVGGGNRSESGSLSATSLIALMASFGVSAPAVRQAVSRLSRQGWLAARRERNRAFYSVTERGRRRIAEVSPRIYGPVIEWDGRWRVLLFAATLARDVRARVQGELRVLGWAPLAAASWISPGDSLEAARAAVEAYGLAASTHFFVGEYRGPLSDRRLVEQCWNLDAIGDAYRAFVDRYRPRLERARGALGDEAAFVERLWLVHDYRRFAYLDPGLPSELVPAHWPGTTAAALFREYYGALERESLRYFRSKAGGG